MNLTNILLEKLISIFEKFEQCGGARSLAPVNRGEEYRLQMHSMAKRERKRWKILAKHIIEINIQPIVVQQIEYMAIQMDCRKILNLFAKVQKI